MSSPYEIRTNDNGKSKKQSMAELKLRRLTELNQRLQEDLNRRRIPVSEAALECVFTPMIVATRAARVIEVPALTYKRRMRTSSFARLSIC